MRTDRPGIDCLPEQPEGEPVLATSASITPSQQRGYSDPRSDDHPLLRHGIASLVNAQPDMELVALMPRTGREAITEYFPGGTLR